MITLNKSFPMILFLFLITPFCVQASQNNPVSSYKKYDPYKNSSLFNKAITGPCSDINHKYDSLDSELKNNVSQMTDAEADKKFDELRNIERERWSCIETELNKSGYTLDLPSLFKMNGL